MASNRERALEAAVELIGTHGIRSLTHLRVDERAGLSRGSTSNHFRTRAALLHGVVDHMVEREGPLVDTTFAPASVDELVDALVELFEHLTGPNRTMTTARLALLVEASHDPDLRAALAEGRTRLERTIVPALAAFGAADPRLVAESLAVCFEGLFLHRLARHAHVDPRPVLDLVVRAGLATQASSASTSTS